MGTLEERALQLQRQRRAKEREKLAEAAASVPSGGGAAPPKKSAKEADAEEKKRLRDLLWKLREGGVADNPEELTQVCDISRFKDSRHPSSHISHPASPIFHRR